MERRLYYLWRVTTISLRLPDHLARDLEQEAGQRHIPKSRLLREALLENLRGRKKTVSCYDLAPHLAGCVAGSRDLSCNKDRLKRVMRARLRAH